MRGLLLAGLGGFIGSAARYTVGLALLRPTITLTFPLAVLVVNVVGSLAIGYLLGNAAARDWLQGDARTFVVIGILGGFTTFSSFSADTLQLWREAGSGRAGLNVLLNLALCLSAVWLGDAIGRGWPR